MDFPKEEFNNNKRPFCLDDLFELIGVSSAKLSPDGIQVLCVITTTNPTVNNRKDSIILINLSNNQQTFLTEGSSPCWSPDGLEFAYESEDGDLWIYNLEKDQKRFLARIYQSSYFMGHMAEKNFSWSPDGKHIAFVSTLPYSTSDGMETEVRVINRLLYKTKGGRGRPFFTDDHLSHVWIIPVSQGEPELITAGNYNEHSISWSSDSGNIAFISNRSENPDNNQSYDLWSINIETKKLERLTEKFGTVFQPACSPDGKMIAFLAITGRITTNDSPSEDTQLYVLPAGGGSPRCLTRLIDRRIENIAWNRGGEFIYFTAGSEGQTSIYRVSVTTGIAETIIAGRFHILEYSLNTINKDIVYVSTDINHPPEVFHFQEQNSITQITNQNESLVSKCRLQDAEEFWFKSFDGTSVQGWIMKPAVFDTAKTYPLILVIHGGPHNMFGYEFEDRMQLLSAHGYAVLFINPRGSSGYGQSFSNGNILNWGGGDYQDLMTGVDCVIDKFKWIDKEKLGVTGQSYGGYMTNWIITQSSRFKVAVVDGGISNLISFSGTSLYHSLMESEFRGNVYDNFHLLWQWSPLRNVKNVTTPTLFLHGESDNEVPVSQAEEMYVALKKAGVKTTFIQYIDEGHGWRPDLRPKNRYDLYQRMINWIDQNVNAV